MRFLGMMLLMLLFSLLQLVIAAPASSALTLTAKEDRQFTIGCSTHDSTVSIREKSDAATHPAPPDAIQKNTYAGVFYRLQPGIVMIPRMNRTPKPKSVYRCFTRAPGSGLVVKYDA